MESKSPIIKFGMIPIFLAEFAPPSAQIITENPFSTKYCTALFEGALPLAIIKHFFN
jgi:hypothetical protein